MSALDFYPWHYWPVSAELAEGTSRKFVCNANGGFRTSAPDYVTCGWCLAWLRSGPTQRAILNRAPGRLAMTLDAPERKAAMRLVRRGVLTRQRFGGPSLGWATVYRVNA